MKFAKELERDLVPEWRIKYLNYKAGKKHIKAIARAINRANTTPSLGLPRKGTDNANHDTPGVEDSYIDDDNAQADEDRLARLTHTQSGRLFSQPARVPSHGERQRLTGGAEHEVHYGSIVSTPPDRQNPASAQAQAQVHKASPLELPGPAMRVSSNTANNPNARPASSHAPSALSLSRQALQRTASMAGSYWGYNNNERPRSPDRLALPPSGATFPSPMSGDMQSPRARLRRMFTLTGSPLDRHASRGDYDLRALDEVREKECDFMQFLDSELDKVETFYRQKEDSAGKRLVLLREQLHEMRNRRTSEIAEAKRRKHDGDSNDTQRKKDGRPNGAHIPLLDPLKAKLFRPGPNSQALQQMKTPALPPQVTDQRRDYARRPVEDEVPYRTAKRKLKLALQEFYRGLELLKSYALLNRTAFRKLNKKYDKTVHARPPYRYMTEKVNKSWFVTSDILEGHLQAVEDLYARYFERGNHKIAAGKLRSLSKKARDESGSAFQNGIFIGVGAVFAIQGLVYGAELLFDEDPEVRTQTAYLLQIYAGYFLMLYLFSLFCLDCKIWTANRVNYPFIFEFDSRSQLDWRQLAEFPSFFLFLFGLFMWINFARYGSPDMYLYYPVILIFVTFVILFLPAPIFFHKSRKWFLYSHWRLFFAGLYPVEFRDFFLGDMYCSLTYAMCNIELFFCLYANSWDEPQNCNSNHSRLLGFFACLPPVWRFLQCIRRYRDTGNIFPHLVNCGKYTASILAGIFLSVYRIQKSHDNLALFVVFSTINGVYTAFWDIFMDFSLLQPHTHHRFLRDVTALKSRWLYYLIMTLDPILRFNWIFYAIFTHDTQHSSTASFFIGFSEVTRRGLWTLLRVENEHCANVKQYRASRDVPLPYDLDSSAEYTTSERQSSEAGGGGGGGGEQQQQQQQQQSSGGGGGGVRNEILRSPSAARVSWTGVVSRTQSRRSDASGASQQRPGSSSGRDGGDDSGGGGGVSTALEAAEEGGAGGGEAGEGQGQQRGTIRRKPRRADTLGSRSIRGILAEAHKQDFEKKKKPELMGGSGALGEAHEEEEEDDDDDDDDDLPASAGISDEERGLMH